MSFLDKDQLNQTVLVLGLFTNEYNDFAANFMYGYIHFADNFMYGFIHFAAKK